ncbi:hypothetical protein [Shewanella fodinae]|nr:hypothetical protein [Shewanella fodinae]GGZ02496.1 hypothetical protein GCM10007169_19100 [Shewanella fodinae]
MGLSIFLLAGLLPGCAYYVYGTHSAYGFQKVDTEEYLGPIDTGYDSKITSPVLTFANGVQVKFSISGMYNYPPKPKDLGMFNNARIEMFITSLMPGIKLDTTGIILDQYRVGKKTLVKFLELKRYPSLARGQNGLLVCRYSELSEKAFYDFYQGDSINIPHRTTDFSLVTSELRSDPTILCGELVAINTNFAGEQGYFTITLPLIEDGMTHEYKVYFYPVGYRFTMK